MRHEFVLPNPTNWAELSKALTAVKNDIEAAGLDSSWDNIVTVQANDEEIVLFWEERPMQEAE